MGVVSEKVGVAKESSADKPESSSAPADATSLEGGESKMEVESKSEGKAEKKVTIATSAGGKGEKKKDEPGFQMIANPARVLPQQVSGWGYKWGSPLITLH